MRENRPYGSEGGEDLPVLPYPYRKSMSTCFPLAARHEMRHRQRERRLKASIYFRVQEGDRVVRGNHWKFRHLRTPSRVR